MAISASEIVDADSFKEWLKDKPLEVGQVIATRCALRVMPIAFDIWKEEETLLSLNEKAQITLACFRANLISLTHNRYSGVNLRNFGNPAAIIADASVSSVENGAAFVAASASSAVSAISVVDKRAVAARAVSSVSYSCVAFSTTFVHGSSWKVVEQDALWLEESDLYTQALILQPLFIYTGELLKEFWDFREKIYSFWQEFNTFANNNASEELRRPLTLIAAWNGAILPAHSEVQSLLGAQLDVKLATQFEEFWEGNPIEVLNRVADLVGWGEPKIAAKMEAIQEDVDANSISLEGISADGALSGEVDGSNDQDSQSRKQLLYQVDYLMATASLHEVTANSIASQIENEVTNYLNVVRINELPEELQVIGRIGGVIRSIGEKVVLASTDPSALKVLKEKIQSLEKELEIAQTELAKPEYRDSFDRYFDIAMESGAKYAGPVILASAAGFVARFADPGMLHELGIAVQNYLRSRP